MPLVYVMCGKPCYMLVILSQGLRPLLNVHCSCWTQTLCLCMLLLFTGITVPPADNPVAPPSLPITTTTCWNGVCGTDATKITANAGSRILRSPRSWASVYPVSTLINLLQVCSVPLSFPFASYNSITTLWLEKVNCTRMSQHQLRCLPFTCSNQIQHFVVKFSIQVLTKRK